MDKIYALGLQRIKNVKCDFALNQTTTYMKKKILLINHL